MWSTAPVTLIRGTVFSRNVRAQENTANGEMDPWKGETVIYFQGSKQNEKSAGCQAGLRGTKSSQLLGNAMEVSLCDGEPRSSDLLLQARASLTDRQL